MSRTIKAIKVIHRSNNNSSKIMIKGGEILLLLFHYKTILGIQI
jgi:hypothetical protein